MHVIQSNIETGCVKKDFRKAQEEGEGWEERGRTNVVTAERKTSDEVIFR